MQKNTAESAEPLGIEPNSDQIHQIIGFYFAKFLHHFFLICKHILLIKRTF